MIGFNPRETEDFLKMLASYQAHRKQRGVEGQLPFDSKELVGCWLKVHGPSGLFTVFRDGDEVIVGDDGEPEIVEGRE